MNAHYVHAATLLPNGQVLVTGGYNNSGFVANAELYDSTTGTWTATGALVNARYFHTGTLLPHGQVLSQPGMATPDLSRVRNSTIRRPALGPTPAP